MWKIDIPPAWAWLSSWVSERNCTPRCLRLFTSVIRLRKVRSQSVELPDVSDGMSAAILESPWSAR